MWSTARQWVVDWFTENGQGSTPACPVRLGGVFMLAIMGVKFILLKAPTADYFQSTGIGAAAIMGAMVVKAHLEDR